MGELNKLALKYGTDKSSEYHNYCGIYESYLKEFKNSNVALFEMGVGGYEYADRGGESLRMWYEYFPYAKIIGIDLYEKENIINDRTEFWQGSQTDKHLLKTILGRIEGAEIKIVIDDASHNNALTIESFHIIFPLLKSGDLYFIEDVHTSYFGDETYGGDENPFQMRRMTTMNFFSELTHQLNGEHLKMEYQNQYSWMVEFIHFYKEMIVLKRF